MSKKMKERDESTLLAAGVEKVFAHRKNFLVIGLTGRTGSGCTTAAAILATQSFDELKLPSVKNPPLNHEDRKLRIVRLWAEKNWKPFATISVTSLILSLAMKGGLDKFLQMAKEVNPAINESVLGERLREFEGPVNSAFEVLENMERAFDIDRTIKAAQTLILRAKVALKIVKDNIGGSSYYTTLFQRLGNNVRMSGCPSKKEIDPDRIFTIPETIEKVIRLLGRIYKVADIAQKYIVIDALRHPYEIRYLRERISSFYTVAVSTEEVERKRRLHALQLTDGQVENLDSLEYPNKISKAKDYAHLVKQNIQACLELADIYISNTGSGPESRLELSRQLVRYVALMQHPGLITPTAAERCMQAAVTARANSGCISRQVGAVVTDSHYSVKAIGWNDVPQGQVPCILRNVSHLIDGNYDSNAYSDYEKMNDGFKSVLISTYKSAALGVASVNGLNLSYCFKTAYNKSVGEDNQVHTRSLHAEENAFLQIAKYGGQSISGGYLFTTASPCELCAKKAYQLGIKRIFYIDPYPGIAISHVLGSGAMRPELTLFEGAIGSAYNDLYQPVMPYKDELPLWLSGLSDSASSGIAPV